MSRMDRRSAVALPVSAADQQLHAGPAAGWPVFAWASNAVTVTASASVHTMGAWTEIVASTSTAVDWLVIATSGVAVSSAATEALLDVGVGGAGAETVVVPTTPAGYSAATVASSRANLVTAVPVFVAAGTRIAARMQAVVSADTATVQVVGYVGSPRYRSPASVDALGAVTASSRGTNMPSNDTYVEVVAATTKPYQALIICPAGGPGGAFSAESSTYTVAVGPGGSEVALGSSLVGTSTAEVISRGDYDLFGIVPAAIPAGSRIACKQSVGRNYRDVIILGVPVS